jgi:hypothetical protein
MQLDVATQRNPGKFPHRAPLIGPSRERLAEADRKGFHMDAAPTGRKVMAHLMDENEDAQDDSEGNKRAEETDDVVHDGPSLAD